MKKRKCVTFLFCLILCYSLFQQTIKAERVSQISLSSQGSISYPQNVNLADIPEDWSLTYSTGPQIIFLDYDFTHTPGKPSIRLERHVDGVDVNYAREVNGHWYSAKPGDHIVAKCWVYVGDSGIGDTSIYSGGRLGIDLYAHTSVGYGVVESYPHSGAEHAASMVHWGTKMWTQKGWDIVVPSTSYTKANVKGTWINCDPVQVDSFVLWLQVLTPTDPGVARFADAELYINPR